ncbi:MAG: triose-phosphate isomerase [Alphaproteobacteria bacterium]|nr:triose-phosphate isomerase [Alphaproteobacteria bacterium]
MKKLIAGNWKMNLSREEVNQLAYDLMTNISPEPGPRVEWLVCPPFLYLDRMTKFFADSPVAVGAQDCSAHDNGAHTGDISARMIAEMGARYVILGHSERRHGHGEVDETVNRKARRAHEAGLIPIICVGETESERAQGREKEIVGRQIMDSLPSSANSANTVIAYEPVWAIGTGKNATPEDAGAMHAFIREALAARIKDAAHMRILYGGSMNADNAGALLATAHVDGGLIGGASLKAESFLAIGRSLKEADG